MTDHGQGDRRPDESLFEGDCRNCLGVGKFRPANGLEYLCPECKGTGKVAL